MEVAVELEVEDDLFFADIDKQISLLIMDDDDDEDPVSRCPSLSIQALTGANYPIIAQSPFFQEQICRRESKGTGVFIPKSSQPRRKHRQGRYNSVNSKPKRQQQQDKSTTKLVSQASYSHPSYPRRV